jgi:hypothetical protein
VSEVDAFKIKAASEAWDELKLAGEGVANTIAAHVAPYLQAAIDKVLEWADSGDGLKAHVGAAQEYVGEGIGVVSDSVEGAIAGFHAISAVALSFASAAVGAFDEVGQTLVNLINLAPGMHASWSSTVHGVREAIDGLRDSEFQAAHDSFKAWSQGSAGTAVRGWFHDIDDASGEAAAAMAKHADDMRSHVGDLGDALHDLGEENAKTWDSLAKRVNEETRTPLEKFRAHLAEYQHLLQTGRIDADTYARAVTKAQEEMAKGGPHAGGKEHGPDLLRAGSAEALAMRYDLGRSQQLQQDVPRQQLAEAQRSNQLLLDLKNAVIDQNQQQQNTSTDPGVDL